MTREDIPRVITFSSREKSANNLYITILGKDLNFIYTTKKEVTFWNNGSPIEGEFKPDQNNTNISFKVVDIDEQGNKLPIKNEIMEALRSDDNLIFIHPDNLIK